MASLRLQGFQYLLRGKSHLLRNQQRRWAQVHDVRFLASHHDPNNVLDKYRAKLDQKAKQEGHESIESLKEAYSDKIQDLRHKASTVISPEPDTPTPGNAVPGTQNPFQAPPPPSQSPTAQAARAATSGSSSGIKPLNSFVDVEKIRDLPPKEIEALWRLRHANNSHSICAVIPVETYHRIAEAARHNPQFILPLPRAQSPEEQQNEQAQQNADGSEAQATAAEIHFLQWAFHPPAEGSAQPANSHTSTVIFTNLGAYKIHGAYAQPHTTVTHHLDLAADKGLVLMHGQVVPNAGVSTSQATWLVSCVQRFYDFEGQANGRKGELLRMFTRGDVQNFKVEELMEETERIQ
ncbi:hypothetical protein NUU61_006902 [Penicillium alfredii]|uniref:F1F0 ATP synthase assembly protein Atp11 n=1 Tax=Penicillium alfredii TaxID=1506179 RepID=A0A9W9F1X4_9EURO|nr:uncharacterized protein NUU61_006902 [Penicillium alfredii]KAJ5092032.1 hypothetical protein NUU61_006902 [Penicillium alfredii]